MALKRMAAAWREKYVANTSAALKADQGECIFCTLSNEEVAEDTGVLWRNDTTFVVLNAFPYGSGHLLVLPRRHVAALGELTEEEYREFFLALRHTTIALEMAYGADGMNIGINLGVAAGAGIPRHLHAHVLPRWSGDTNFMTSIGETRVLSESLGATWQKVHRHF
ncbi:MAG: HIT domain-containing protein [Acidimicrobiales bacterium]